MVKKKANDLVIESTEKERNFDGWDRDRKNQSWSDRSKNEIPYNLEPFYQFQTIRNQAQAIKSMVFSSNLPQRVEKSYLITSWRPKPREISLNMKCSQIQGHFLACLTNRIQTRDQK